MKENVGMSLRGASILGPKFIIIAGVVSHILAVAVLNSPGHINGPPGSSS